MWNFGFSFDTFIQISLLSLKEEEEQEEEQEEEVNCKESYQVVEETWNCGRGIGFGIIPI